MPEYLVQIVIDILDFDGNPEEITRFLALTPTTTAEKGARNSKGIVQRRNRWHLYSEPSLDLPGAADSVEVHWTHLHGLIAGKESLFRDLSLRCKTKMTIIVWQGERYPALPLGRDMIAYACAANFSIIDVYICE